MLQSLQRHCPSATVWVLCLDDRAYQTLALLGLERVRPLKLGDLERADPSVLTARSNRSKLEYYFTLTAPLLRYVLNVDASIETLSYVDADVCFFGDPEVILREMGDRTIGIIEHRYPDFLADHRRWGIYNVGIVTFRRSPEALACIDWWRDRCLEWCYDRLEGDKYADQKYLDQWPSRFPNVAVIQNQVVGLAPWNIPRYSLSVQADRLLVDGEPVVAYHFSRFRIITDWLFDTGVRWFGYTLDPLARDHVYLPYARQIARAEASLKGLTRSSSERDTLQQREPLTHLLAHGWADRLWVLLCALRRRSLLVAPARRLDEASAIDDRPTSSTAQLI